GGAPGLSGVADLSVGSKSTREANLSASFVEGPIAATVGFRRMTTENDLPNDFFAVTNASASVEATLSPDARVGFVLRRDEGRSGIPFSGNSATPNRSTTFETTTASVPLSLALGAGFQLDAAATFSKDRPTFSDIDDPYGFTFSRTDAERIGGRVTLSRKLGIQRLTVGADYERTLVTNEDAYALELDDLSIRTWSLFLEDRISLIADKLSATVGIRRDDHSTFGSATSPRLSIAYRPIPTLKLRAGVGSAFRSPTTGELFYPYSGSTSLQPERSVAYELGAELDVAPHVTLEATLFQNNIRDLITYDFVTSLNTNVNRARTSGVELSLRGTFGQRMFGRVSYSYLDAQDLDLDQALLRRPHHRASATIGALIGKEASAELTGLFVGSRSDVDAATFAAVQDASYVRLDAAIRGPRVFEHFAPFLRVTNVLGREYVEAAGYPSPGRRVSVGLQIAF
ncbi:MAG: TonB-dependent receptor, partial [Thermoanaerobaculia bacterium]